MIVLVTFLAYFAWLTSAASRTGTFTVQPYAAKPLMGLTYSFHGEGIAYDPVKDRVLMGSLIDGNIYSVPYYAGYDSETDRVVYDKDDMSNIFTAGNKYVKI
jgi:hypothetical protein